MSEIILKQSDIDKYVTPKINKQDIIDNLIVDTATWALDLWEEELGIDTVIDDTLENRRSRIKAKLRGYGVCTKKHIKNVALSYGYGEVEPIEHYEDYMLEIKFISTLGLPPNLNNFKKTMRLIVPAHIGIKYTFRYNTWQDVFNLGEWQKTKDKGTWEDTRSKG